mmetsp:Transcript_6953/g.20858  ORF Transcript_6953/g.20858 Transcript_6953/m.20858 type:complete len:92 (+) Transcript_6953:849-1124(+)
MSCPWKILDEIRFIRAKLVIRNVRSEVLSVFLKGKKRELTFVLFFSPLGRCFKYPERKNISQCSKKDIDTAIKKEINGIMEKDVLQHISLD